MFFTILSYTKILRIFLIFNRLGSLPNRKRGPEKDFEGRWGCSGARAPAWISMEDANYIHVMRHIFEHQLSIIGPAGPSVSFFELAMRMQRSFLSGLSIESSPSSFA
jgi:hypothetical protein